MPGDRKALSGKAAAEQRVGEAETGKYGLTLDIC